MWNDEWGEHGFYIVHLIGVSEMAYKCIRDYENLVAYYHNLKRISNCLVEHLIIYDLVTGLLGNFYFCFGKSGSIFVDQNL